jgi:hypothetical protein
MSARNQPPKTQIAEDGLRYTSKAAGSAFAKFGRQGIEPRRARQVVDLACIQHPYVTQSALGGSIPLE